MTLEIERIKKTVLQNCDISDAAYAGIYSICTLVLLLRNLFKWEKGAAPWEEKGADEILLWIGEKEEKWETLSETDFIPVSIDGKTFDPFDTEAINDALLPRNLCYGAGYAHGLKPTFFLAVCEQSEIIHEIPLRRLGRELARDLLTLPALTQNDGILFREQSARMFFWDQILYIRKSGRPALEVGLKACGLEDTRPATVRSGFEKVFRSQTNGYIHHELGEIKDTVFDRAIWREVISQFPHTPVELIARVVKDVLADTHPYGTLPHIIAEENTVAIGCYEAFRGPLARQLFPDFEKSFWAFTRKNAWAEIAAAVDAIRNTAKAYADFITAVYLEGKRKSDLPWIRKEIEHRFL